MKHSVILWFLSFFLISAVNCVAQASDKAGRIDSLIKAANRVGVFNGNILVAQKGKIIYSSAHGYANASKTKMLDTTLLFDIGSVSKEFNGVSIMLLKEKGKLTLDDPLSKFLPELPSWASKVKVRHLINYTSGLPGLSPTSDESDSAMLNKLKAIKELQFEPGTAYIYTHSNVYLQMRIVEKLSGMPYASFIKQNIFIPCGMRNAIVDAPVDGANMAQAFDNDFRSTPYAQSTSGWVRLTAGDLYRFTTCLENFQLISKKSFEELAANFPGGESSIGTTGFTDGALQWHRHQGSNSNYEALVYTDHLQDASIVLLTNNQNFKVDAIKTAILSILADKPYHVPKRSVYLDIREKVLSNLDSGLAVYRDMKANRQDVYDFSFAVGDLISTGKFLQRRNKLDDAIALFHLALQLDAKAEDKSYAYELIAECYFKKKSLTQSLMYYETALSVYPGNKNAKGMITQILELKRGIVTQP